MKKSLLSCCAILFISLSGFSQTNLLDTFTWTLGTGSVTGFNHFGSEAVNTRIDDLNPHEEQKVIWVGTPEEGANRSGGWVSSRIPIDHTKDYRISVWLKKTNSPVGHGQLGIFCRNRLSRFTAIDLSTGEIAAYSVMFSNGLPELDKWYLVVGYIYNSLHMGTTIDGGVFDPITGNKVLDARATYRFHPEATTVEHFSYSYDANTANSQYFWDPRIEALDGDAPTIEELLAGRDAPMPTELVFDYDSSGNNKLRSKPQAQSRIASAQGASAYSSNQVAAYPPGYFDNPISEQERYEDLANSIMVHPNPTSGELFANWDEKFSDMVVDVVATDFSGKAIPVSFIPGTLAAEVNLTSYPSGIYLFGFLLYDGRQIEKKVIKE